MENNTDPNLISEIDAFLARTGMGQAYFGKLAAGNSEVVARLRAGRRVWPETALAIRRFIADRLTSTDRAV